MRTFFILTWLLLSILPPVISAETNTTQPDQADSGSLELKEGPPDLAELLPRVIDLSDRIVDMEMRFMAMQDLSLLPMGFSQTQKKIEAIRERFETLKLLSTYSAKQFSSIEVDLNREAAIFKKMVQDLSEMIAELESLERFWTHERQQWDAWQTFIPQATELRKDIDPLFAAAEESCQTALDMISKKLEPSIMVQSQAIGISAMVADFRSDMGKARKNVKVGTLKQYTPPMFSARYFKKFDRWMIDDVKLGLENIDIPVLKVFRQDKNVIGIQLLAAIMLIILVRRYRVKLEQINQGQFYAQRPFSFSIFVSTIMLTPYYISTDPFLYLLLTGMAGFSAARLVGGYFPQKWVAPIFYGLVTLMIVTQLLPVLTIPLPITRLFIFSMTLLGLVFAAMHFYAAYRGKTSRRYTWFVGICALILSMVVVLEAVGDSKLSRHLFRSLTDTIYISFVTWMLILMVQDFVELIIRSRFLQQFEYLRSSTTVLITRVVQISRVIILFTMASFILETWFQAKSAVAVMKKFFSLGVSFGEFHLNIGVVVTAVVCLYGTIIISFIIQAVLSETTYRDKSIEHGVRVSIFKLIHYAFVFIGFLLALMVLGVEMKSITIIGGAMGVGIGFGLQGIVMNFIAGIILLFERPVKVGDRIIVDGQWGEIGSLGLRSTVVKMFDRSEIVIPNHDFISKNVTNWTLSDRVMRVTVAVGVAYGSDIQKVIQVLKNCAMVSPKILRAPEPQVLFKKFGESSLDFELRAWIFNVDDFYLVTSFLHEEIDKRFRESGITIAFPQRDLHIRSVPAPGEA